MNYINATSDLPWGKVFSTMANGILSIITVCLAAMTITACSSKPKAADTVSLVSANTSATNWAATGIAAGSTSKISSPTITASVPIDNVTVTLYLVSDCSTKPIATATSKNGSVTLTNFTLTTDGAITFYYKIADSQNNSTSCKATAFTYTLDTSPLPPTIGTVPQYSLHANTTLPITSCNDSDKYLVATTQPAVTDPGWTACGVASGLSVTLVEGSNTLTIWGLNVTKGKVSSTSSTATITLDTIPPANVTSWTMSSPVAGSYTSNASPTITGTAPENTDTVSLYTASNCATASLAGTGTVASGSFSISSFTLTTDGTYTFYYTIADPAGNTLACNTTGLSYTLDATAPTNPGIAINSGDTTTNFRTVTLTLSATETLSLPMQMCVAEDTNCSTCSWATFAAAKSVNLSTGSGTKTVSAKYRDAAGNTTACVSASININALSVGPKYIAAPNWNDYVKAANTTTACDGSETSNTACIHGGEARRVITSRSSCTSLSMTDTLGAFDWTCSVVSGAAVFDSTLKVGKGLKDLVSATAWNNNSVSLTYTIYTTTSTPAQWWTNTVQALPSNSSSTASTLASASTVYTLSSSAQTSGYVIAADNIALVALGGATLSWNAGAAGVAENCYSDVGSIGSPDLRCIVYAGMQKFLWIEGAFNGGATNLPNYDILLNMVTLSKVNQVYVTNAASAGLKLYLNSSYNIVTQVRAANNITAGVQIDSSASNSLNQINVANNTSYGLRFLYASNNSATQVYANSNGNAGVYIEAGDSNILGGVTANNNGANGLYLLNSNHNIISNLVASNNVRGIYNTLSNYNTFSQIAATDNTTGILLSTSSYNKFTGNLIVGNATNCTVSGGTAAGLVNSTCTDTGTLGSSGYPTNFASNALLMVSATTPLTSVNSFIGKATADSANTSALGGTATYSSALDWINYANISRNWGKDGGTFPASTNQGRCSTGTCRIWDWSLSVFDTFLLNVSGNASTANDPNSLGACPTQIDGTVYITDQSSTYTFLTNAIEINDDKTGNNNGLCESNEACIYTPNFGAYQGHGTLQSCIFNDAKVSGVKMYWYSTNGR